MHQAGHDHAPREEAPERDEPARIERVEKDPTRRRMLTCVCVAGVGIGAYLLYPK